MCHALVDSEYIISFILHQSIHSYPHFRHKENRIPQGGEVTEL